MPYFSDTSKKNVCKHSASFLRPSNSELSQTNSRHTSVQFLQDRCHILEHILCYSEISPMNNIIKDFESMSDFYLRQLAKEIEIYRFSSDERSQLLDFLNYLRSVTREIEDMLLVQH